MAIACVGVALLAAAALHAGRGGEKGGSAAGPPARGGGGQERGLGAGERRAGRGRVRAAVAVLAGGRRVGTHPRELPVAPRGAAARAGLRRGSRGGGGGHRRPARGRGRGPGDRGGRGGGRGPDRGGLAGVTGRAGGGRRPAGRGIPGPGRGVGRGVQHRRRGAARRRPAGTLPASGIRVLDLTRVIAGPVATRYLAALGADVLRLDPPGRPELRLQAYDELLGKRSALLDFGTPGGAGPAARAAGRRRRAGARIPAARARPVRAGAAGSRGTPSRPGRGEPVGLGQERPVGRTARFRQHRPGRVRDRGHRVPRWRAPGRAALPASRSRHRLPVRGRRASRARRAGHPGRHPVPRAVPGPDRAVAAQPSRGPQPRAGGRAAQQRPGGLADDAWPARTDRSP